ncbi:MAG TPA: polysaccharide biosynthesis C-terminal domain-containing protein [Flavipsychrobacter sp.]|nr:polysaccharide biosynthesis C-terminal domain-containing protein [Flavipsychrobacter sp.]
MGIVFRQSVKTSIVTFAGAFLGAVTLYLGAKLIPKQQLGFIRNTLPEQAALFAQVFSFGLNVTMMVYVHKYAVNDKRRTALISMNLILPTLCLICLLPVYLFYKNDVVNLFQPHDRNLIDSFYIWLPILTLFFLYMLVLEQYLMSQLKVAAATFMREVLLRVLTIGLIVLYGYNLISFQTFVPSTVLVFILPILLLIFLTIKTEGFKINFNWNVFTKADRKELVSFTWYHFLLTISINMMAKIDIILLGMWSSLSAAAVYGIAVYILSFLQIPYRAMLMASFPILTKAFHDNDMQKVRDVFLRSSLNILVASVGLAAIICCNLHNAIAILPQGYEAIVPLVLILIIGKLFDLSTGMNDQLLSISNYYRFSFLISVIIVVLLIIFNYLLIPKYAYYGAAVATTIALMVFNIAKLVYVNAKLSLQPFSKKSFLIVIAGGAAAVVGYIFPFVLNPVVDAIIRSLIIVITYLSLLIILKPSQDLNTYLLSVKQNKRLF